MEARSAGQTEPRRLSKATIQTYVDSRVRPYGEYESVYKEGRVSEKYLRYKKKMNREN